MPNWKDLSPRFGMAYDLFGNGKTALKFTLSRYVVADTNPAFSNGTTVNPIFFNLSATRSWSDTAPCAGGIQGDFTPQPCELGTLSNPAFGTSATTTHNDPAILSGWGVRPYDWETSVGIQHQLFPRLAVNASYTRRWYKNFVLTDNLALTSANYDEYCATAPNDARLGSVAGSQICGLYDLNPAARSITPNNLRTSAGAYGTIKEVYQGVDVTMSARLPFKGTLSGGVNVGPQANNAEACFSVDSPQAGALLAAPATGRYCKTAYPWKTSLRLNGGFELPWGINTGVSFQSVPGPEVQAVYTVANADIAAGTVKFVSPSRTTFGGGSATFQLLAPGALYADRLNQLDVRLAKVVQMGRVRARLSVDFGNLLNVSTVLQLNNTYGSSWQRPANILPGRIIKPGIQLEF